MAVIRVRICCINSVEEVLLAVEYGASVLGLSGNTPSGDACLFNHMDKLWWSFGSWTVIVSLLGWQGFYKQTDAFPPRMAYILLPATIAHLVYLSHVLALKHGRQ